MIEIKKTFALIKELKRKADRKFSSSHKYLERYLRLKFLSIWGESGVETTRENLSIAESLPEKFSFVVKVDRRT